MAIHRFIHLIEEDQPVPMFGDGSSARDYTYVDDIVDGMLAALDQCDGYRIYNLGNSNPIKLKALIEKIGEAVGKQPQVTQLPFQPGDVEITFADISRAKEELGYAPDVPIEEGIKKAVAWYRDGEKTF